MSDYRFKRTVSDEFPDNDNATDLYCAAMDRVIETPAPSLAALATKMDLVSERYEQRDLSDDVWPVIKGDVERVVTASAAVDDQALEMQTLLHRISYLATTIEFAFEHINLPNEEIRVAAGQVESFAQIINETADKCREMAEQIEAAL